MKTFAKDADRELLDKLSDIEDLGNKALRPKCTEEQRNVCSDNKSCAFTNKDINSKTLDDWCFVDDIATKMIVIDCGDHTWYKCYTLGDVFSVIEKSTDYKLIAGNTGQGKYEYNNTIIYAPVQEAIGVIRHQLWTYKGMIILLCFEYRLKIS